MSVTSKRRKGRMRGVRRLEILSGEMGEKELEEKRYKDDMKIA